MQNQRVCDDIVYMKFSILVNSKLHRFPSKRLIVVDNPNGFQCILLIAHCSSKSTILEQGIIAPNHLLGENMIRELVECIPNFSAARNKEVVEKIVEAIKQTQGAMLLDYSSDNDRFEVEINVTDTNYVGEHIVRINATDANGNTDAQNTTVQINSQSAPMIIYVVSSPNPVMRDGAFTIAAYVMDQDGNLDPDNIYVDLTNVSLANNVQLWDNNTDNIFAADQTTNSDRCYSRTLSISQVLHEANSILIDIKIDL